MVDVIKCKMEFPFPKNSYDEESFLKHLWYAFWAKDFLHITTYRYQEQFFDEESIKGKALHFEKNEEGIFIFAKEKRKEDKEFIKENTILIPSCLGIYKNHFLHITHVSHFSIKRNLK